jgi:elongation factor Ts
LKTGAQDIKHPDGMQVAADADIAVVSPEDVPEEVLAKQRELEMAKEDLASKPENIRSKIVEGRLKKFAESQVSVWLD